MKKLFRRSGFTLIELMIVVAIIGILSTLALPNFADRVIRAQVSTAIDMTEVARSAVEKQYRTYRTVPKNNKVAGLPEAGKFIGNYVKSVEVDNGAIHITLGNRVNKFADGMVLTMRPAVVKGQPIVPISWICGNAGVPSGMTVLGENRTTLPSTMLPIDCRT